ncbi:hypothetical protein AVEN_176891-1 [Araneus ventricosus]|uniref:Uncharacterized protein n=1 Tax=Araneus ventricosus TaxID=182803 RepID=A0A4Y2NE29_ARAVE|nr:hypothetical protein AVEN_176891-1 [Araneus ventricosus]
MSSYRLDAHQSRKPQNRANFTGVNLFRHSIHHGCLSRGLNSVPCLVRKNPLGIRSPPLLKRRTRRPPFVLFLQPKSPLLYVTGSHVTPLSNVLESSEQVQRFHQPQ